MSKKISDLAFADTLTGDELIPLVQNGVTKKALKSAFGGGGGVTSVTYDELVSKINASQLTRGSQYLITDYVTVHFIVDGNGTQYLGDIITGVNEPLLVIASSANTLEPIAYSSLHPEDIIHYDWNPDNWIDDLSFADLSGTPAIVTGFKGVIYFRHDTILDNYMGYDFRNCKFRRWKTNATAWDSGTEYSAGNFVSHSNGVYRSLQDTNTNNTPSDGSAYWVLLLNLTLNEYWFTNASNFPGLFIPSGTEHQDFYTFTENGGATYEKCCRGNHFQPFRDTNSTFYISGTILQNNVFFLVDDVTQYRVDGNTMGILNFGNTIYGQFQENVFGTYLYNNIFWNNLETCQGISSGNDFGLNILVAVNGLFVGNYFDVNVVGNNSTNYSCGNDFAYNTIGNDLLHNTFCNGVRSNYIGNGFKKNKVADAVANVNYSGATHVYADYNTNIFIREDGTAKLSYCNNSDTIVIVNANS